MTILVASVQSTGGEPRVDAEVVDALADVVTDYGLLALLKSDDLRELAECGAHSRYDSGDRLVVEGAVALIVHGVATAFVRGRPRLFHRGGFVSASSNSRLRALAVGAALYFPRALVERKAKESPRFGSALVHSIHHQVDYGWGRAH